MYVKINENGYLNTGRQITKWR